MSRQILTIGSSFYPLQGIARVSTVQWVPRRGVLAWKALKALILASIAWVGASLAGAVNADAGVIVGLLAIAATLLAGYRIFQAFRSKAYYGLVIETAGDPHTALINDDADLLAGIASKIMAAINDPAITFHQQVNNFKHVGDIFGGDKVMRDKKVSG